MRTLFLTAAILGAAVTGTRAMPAEWYETKYDSILKPGFDDCSMIRVSNLEFECDRAKFELSSGEIYLLPTVSGEVWGCVFSGSGRVLLDPPNDIEKFSLDRHLGVETLDLPFSRFRMMASPDIIARIFDVASGERSKASSRAGSFAKDSRGAAKKEKHNIEAEILAELAGQPGDFAWIDLDSDKGRVALSYNSRQTESLKLWRWVGKFKDNYHELIMSAFPREHYESGNSWKRRDQVRLIRPLKYTMDAEISERAHFHCNAKLDFVSNLDSLISLRADIFYKTDIDSVLDGQGRSLYVSKMKEEPGFTVFLSEPLAQGDTSSLTFFYRSREIISKSPWGDFYISTQLLWYPVIEHRSEALFDATFRCHKNLTVISVGDNVSDSTSGYTRFSRWVTRQPEVYTTFNYGLFDSLTVSENGAPAVKVFRSKSHPASLFGPDMKMNVGMDVARALKFYASAFGQIPYDPIYVTEIPWGYYGFAPHASTYVTGIPGGYGQGSPGLIHLSWGTFQKEQPIWDAQFRAHEVAHQWWAHTVRWESYHDQWLAEALAEFSGAWYVQLGREEGSAYFKILAEFRKDLLQKGKAGSEWNEGTEAGPMWLGQRLISSQSSDFRTVVYSKGAYVVHMLRCMMKDWYADSDQRFINMMKDLVKTYYRKTVTTEDFRRMVEKHYGESLNWFFDQWVYGTEIPEFEFRHEVREENGKHFVDVMIAQKRVPSDFKSIIPIRIKFADDVWTVVNVTVVGSRTEQTLPPMPYKPEKIDFNYYEAVLAR